MPTWQCDIIIRSVDLIKDSLHPDRPDEVAMPAQMPEVTTSERACIYNTNGKCHWCHAVRWHAHCRQTQDPAQSL
eukprot:475785-Pelagomonas_calceolata.AAC.1